MKILIAIFAIFLSIPFFSTSNIYADEPVRVSIDGEIITFEGQQPVIVGGRTLVPVRGVFEHLGFDVDWNPEARQATLENDDFVVVLTIDNDVFTTNSEELRLDVPSQIIGGSTMIPFRAVFESVGYYVEWDAASRTVVISSTPSTYITIRGVRYSTNLTELDLDSMELTNEDILPLSYMTNLRWLSLYSNQISDISPLSNLTNLNHLYLFNNQISDISPLANLTNLSRLYLFNNQISDISSLSGLTNL